MKDYSELKRICKSRSFAANVLYGEFNKQPIGRLHEFFDSLLVDLLNVQLSQPQSTAHASLTIFVGSIANILLEKIENERNPT